MTTYNTGNPLGSADPRDLFDNAENLDSAVNTQDNDEWVDRLGVTRKTFKGMENDFQSFLLSSGYEDLGAYQAGIQVTARNQIILSAGEYWRVAASTTLPYTTTGAGMPEGGAFVSVGDAVLRQDLAADGGVALVNGATKLFDTVAKMKSATWLTDGDQVSVVEISDALLTVATGLTADESMVFALDNGLFAQVVSTRRNTLVVRGTTADQVQAAIKYAYENDDIQILQFERKEYLLDKAIFFNSYPGVSGALDRGLVVIANGAIFKLTQATAGGSVINFGRGADVGNGDAIERTGNVTWFGGTVDGDSIAGENGWAFARAENMTFHGIRSINCKRDYVGTREGGRGLTAHDRCRNVNIYGYSALNCSDYFHISHLPDYTSSASGNAAITAITNAAQAVVTAPGHVFQIGDFAAIYNAAGMPEINPTYSNEALYEVVGVSGDDFTIDLNTTSFGAYTSGGRAVIADMTDGGKSPAVNLFGGYAELCEYSLINVEGANQPKTTRFIQTVGVFGVVAKNCGYTAGRGLINGNNAVRLVADVTSYHEPGFNPKSLTRGSFQGSSIKITADVTGIESLVDGRPTEDNPAGTGIDAGLPSHPYGTSADNDISIKVKHRNDVQSGITSYIRLEDVAGSSIDRFYRNRVEIFFTGLSDGVGAGNNFSNIPLHHTNTVLIRDVNLGREFEGQLLRVRNFDHGVNSKSFGWDASYFDEVVYAEDAGGGFSRFGHVDSSGVLQGGFDYSYSNNRHIVRLNGNTSNYQFSDVAIFPSFDNLRDIGTPGLRVRTVYAGTDSISTSDERLKQQGRSVSEAERAVAVKAKGLLKAYRFNDAVELKGDSARIHFGVYAQELASAFTSEGLDAGDYAMFCYDEWDDEFDDEGRLTLKSGNRYGVRYDELLSFIICAL